MNKFHSFNVDDAVLYGTEKALILQHMRHWLDLHQAENKHINKYLKPESDFYGRSFYWTFFTATGLQKILPYLGNVRKIYRLLEQLEVDGVIISATLSENKQNRVKSYSIPLEYPCVKNGNSIVKNGNSIVKNDNCYRSNNISNITKSNILENEKYDLQIQVDPLPETPSKVYLDIAKLIGIKKDINIIYQQFLGHLQAKNYSNIDYSRKRGMWRTYLATAKLYKSVSENRENKKQSLNYDPLGVNDTSWGDEFNEELEEGDF